MGEDKITIIIMVYPRIKVSCFKSSNGIWIPNVSSSCRSPFCFVAPQLSFCFFIMAHFTTTTCFSHSPNLFHYYRALVGSDSCTVPPQVR